MQPAISGALTVAAGSAVSPKSRNLSVSAPLTSPTRTTVSIMPAGGMQTTHSRVFISASNEWFHGPVVMAMWCAKSIAMVHEIVITLLRLPSNVVTHTTGPGSMNVNARATGTSSY